MATVTPMLPEYEVDLPAEEVVRWIEAEQARGEPLTFDVLCEAHYVAEEDFDRRAYDLDDGTEFDLISARARLTVEPHVEHNYWILQVRLRHVLGPRPKDREPFESGPISVAEFRRRFLSDPDAVRQVVVSFETHEARHHFDDWTAEMKNRHGLHATEASGVVASVPND